MGPRAGMYLISGWLYLEVVYTVLLVRPTRFIVIIIMILLEVRLIRFVENRYTRYSYSVQWGL